ncbi:hypothetical protein TKK_0007528 [Trichogramma kaykai]|uniref:Uncharacterized protein n=1 Tax=Trichogramma kaykai TaxID=54128 RepID=A0ABD2WGU7_9HYME
MGSSRPVDRSIGEATFLPQWMKGKMDTRYDYGETAFSPPADDDFFVIRYAKHQEQLKASANNAQEGFRQFNEGQAAAAGVTQPAAQITQTPTTSFSRGPLAFQSFIPFMSDRVCEPKIVLANKSNKSSDDESSCNNNNTTTQDRGRSIVSVASQLVSSKFGKANSADSAAASGSSSSKPSNDSAANGFAQQQKVSKSLPATPLTSPAGTPEGSPKTRRRHRYFNGGAFVADGERKGWLLSSILGQSREFIAPKKIDEEEESQLDQVPAHAFSRKKSISSQNLTYLGKEDASGAEKNSGNNASLSILKVNPSELREMNFWTPTSM